jgi:hypothetical protein
LDKLLRHEGGGLMDYKVEVDDLVRELRADGCEVSVEHAGCGVEIVRARKNGGNVTAGPFSNGYAFSEEIFYGDDGISEVGESWVNDEGTARDLANDMAWFLR